MEPDAVIELVKSSAAVAEADTQRAESETKVDDTTTPPAQREEAEETE